MSFLKTRSKDLTVGSIPRHIIVFAIPMLIGNLLQSSYALINSFWVGNYIGSNAVGATRVTSPIQFMMVAIAAGSTIATSILVAQSFGAKDYKKMSKVIGNSFSIALVLGLILTSVGILFGDNLLHALNVAPDQFQMASSYFRLMMIAFLPSFFSLLITAILRGLGDTVTPLIFMANGVVINAILDPFLIIGIGPFPALGTDGAAIASIISQVIGLLIALIYLNRKNHVVAVKLSSFSYDRPTAIRIFVVGFPSMIQQSIVSIGSACIFGIVNIYGESATNAFGGCGLLEMFIFLPALSFGMAATSITGQNIGANKLDRVKSIYNWAAIMTAGITILITIVLNIFADPILTNVFGFGKDPESLARGIDYIRYVSPSYLFFALMMVSNGIMNGAGKTFITMIFSLFAVIVLRIPLALLFSFVFNMGTHGIWISISTAFITMSIISFLFYKSGIWKKGKHTSPSPSEQIQLEGPTNEPLA